MVRPHLGGVYLLHAAAVLAVARAAEGVLQDGGGALAADGLADGWRDGARHLFRQSGAALYGDGVARHRR